MNKINLKIVSDCSATTMLIDKNGHILDGVVDIKWSQEAGKLSKAIITLIDVPIEVTMNDLRFSVKKEKAIAPQIIYECFICGKSSERFLDREPIACPRCHRADWRNWVKLKAETVDVSSPFDITLTNTITVGAE